jgi:hypothetical protein
MEDLLIAKCVHGERPIIKGHSYDLAMYQVRDLFYSASHCPECCLRSETPRYAGQIAAYNAGLDSLEAHDDEEHAAPARAAR